MAGCTFTPVYGEYGVSLQRLEFAYAKPATRLDQIIIQDLALKLGKSQRPDAPLVTISSGAASRAVTRTGTAKPATQREVTVSVSYPVIAGGRVVASGSRSASALDTTSGQVLADSAAYGDAEERAARAAGETVRLSILAALATPVRQSAFSSGQ
ncbi:MAG: hypothetical protein Q8L54_02205 [Devosia sp.]|nr:hypothetical protein [Devosia sp.]